MKRVFSVLLVALLLAGCASAPSPSDPVGSTITAETATAETPVGNGEPLRLLQHGDEKQYYTQETFGERNDMILYHVVDLQTGEDTIPCDVEGCTHDSKSCPAVTAQIPSYQPYVLNDDTLLVLSGMNFSTRSSFITLMDRNCQNRRVVKKLEGVDLLQDPYHMYTDGDFLYCFGCERKVGLGVTINAIYRIDLSDGTTTNLTKNFYNLRFMIGAVGRDLVLYQENLTYPDVTGDPTTDALSHPTGTRSHFLLNVDTGQIRDFCSYSSDNYVLDRLSFYVIGGQYYWIDSTAGTLSTVDPATGESRLLTDQLPVTPPDEPPADYLYQIEANLHGWLIFYSLPLLVNAETGEVRQRADLPENYWNGYGHQPQIFLQLKDRLLVDCRYEAYTRTDIGTDGTPYNVESNQMYLGLISIDDFLNGIPNYTEVCKWLS